jgi:hypothetical protein
MKKMGITGQALKERDSSIGPRFREALQPDRCAAGKVKQNQGEKRSIGN